MASAVTFWVSERAMWKDLDLHVSTSVDVVACRWLRLMFCLRTKESLTSPGIWPHRVQAICSPVWPLNGLLLGQEGFVVEVRLTHYQHSLHAQICHQQNGCFLCFVVGMASILSQTIALISSKRGIESRCLCPGNYFFCFAGQDDGELYCIIMHFVQCLYRNSQICWCLLVYHVISTLQQTKGNTRCLYGILCAQNLGFLSDLWISTANIRGCGIRVMWWA